MKKVDQLALGLLLASGVACTQAPTRSTAAFTPPTWVCPAPAAAAGAPTTSAPTAAESAPATRTISPAPGADPYHTRIVIVEWKIKKGRECDFLNYWATKSTVPDRTGLLGEFMSAVDPRPWITWSNLSDKWTTFYNIGIWRDFADFEEQIGKHIDNARPPMEFEAAKRSRIFLAPQRWRVGNVSLPENDADGVK